MAINTNSAMYKWLLDKWYTASEIQQMYNDVSAGKNAKEVVAAMDAQKAKSNTSTPKTETITYNWQVSNGNKSWTANMNSMSQSSAINNSRNAQVNTWDVVDMPKQQTTSLNQTAPSDQKFAQSWESMSATQQKNALSRSKALNDYIASKWLTVKKEETPTQTTTTATTPKKTTTTPKQEQWDYQDNSQARMDEIARNLNWYRVTNPDLFKDPSAFYTFFIDGKGRSQDQIDYLWDYFNNVQKYWKYDNMSPDTIGNWLTDGSIPEDYLDYLKSIDPNKYQEVIAARQNAQDTIKYEDYLNSTAALAWMEGYESEPSSIKYWKWNWIWMDEDNNWVDDRREHYASEEEQWYQKEIADINARNLDIDNTVKHTYDDYVKKYPWATKATLMAMAQDTNADLLREKENNLVELTRLQGYVSYMQAERFEMNEAGADSIKQLQDNLKMYYQYSPEWMAELAQAQYAATNITLDQADSWNETQKQMALQNVLDGYYDKYWDIIQRSEQQVINDVIAYAKKNWVWLAEALQENFVKPLQAKPWFAQLNSITTNNPDVFKIWDDMYWYWDENWNLTPISSSVTPSWTWTMRTERNNNPTAMITAYAKQLWWIEWVDYVQWDSFTWKDGRVYYTAKLLGDPIETTIRLLDRWVANNVKPNVFSAWSYASDLWMTNERRKNMSQEEKKNLILKMLQHEWWDINKMAYYNNQQWVQSSTSWQLYNPSLTQIFKQRWDKPDTANAVKDFRNTYWDEVAAAWVSKEDFLRQYDEWYEEQSADAYLDILSHLDQLIELTWDERDLWERFSTIFWIWDVGAAYDYIKNNLTVQWLRDAKQQWLKLWVLSDSDVRMIWKAATTLSRMQWQKSWNKELNAFREKLLSKNKYLRDRYQNNSAYSNDKTISFDEWNRTFTIWTKSNNAEAKTKDIKNLWRVGKRMPEF